MKTTLLCLLILFLISGMNYAQESYTTQPNETLQEVADAQGVTVEELAAANNMSVGGTLFPYTELIIPTKGENQFGFYEDYLEAYTGGQIYSDDHYEGYAVTVNLLIAPWPKGMTEDSISKIIPYIHTNFLFDRVDTKKNSNNEKGVNFGVGAGVRLQEKDYYWLFQVGYEGLIIDQKLFTNAINHREIHYLGGAIEYRNFTRRNNGYGAIAEFFVGISGRFTIASKTPTYDWQYLPASHNMLSHYTQQYIGTAFDIRLSDSSSFMLSFSPMVKMTEYNFPGGMKLYFEPGLAFDLYQYNTPAVNLYAGYQLGDNAFNKRLIIAMSLNWGWLEKLSNIK